MAVQQTTQPTRPTRREKVGVIDVGGGLRSAYSTGVLDYCLDNGIHFDYGLGVSAGAANITSYLAGQRGRPLRFYTKYCPRPEYMSLGNFLRDGSYLGLDYIYGTLMNEDGEDPLDYDALVAGGVPYRITVTDALSGMPKYLGPESMSRNHYDALKATACLPVLDKPYPLDGRPYFDGTISDPIPFRQAFADGCTKLVVILTRPARFLPQSRQRHRQLDDARRPLPRGGTRTGEPRAYLQCRAQYVQETRGAGQGAHHRAEEHRRREHAHQGSRQDSEPLQPRL